MLRNVSRAQFIQFVIIIMFILHSVFRLTHTHFILIFSQHFQHVIHHNFLFSRVSSRIFFSFTCTHTLTLIHIITHSLYSIQLLNIHCYVETSNSHAFKRCFRLTYFFLLNSRKDLKKKRREKKTHTRVSPLNLLRILCALNM